IYSKRYLHQDEEPFFVRGQNSSVLINDKPRVAIAICYELSIPQHSEDAFKNGAEIYLASVAKTPQGVDKASKSLSDIAKNYSMAVLMSNCIGYCDGADCGGKTSVWNKTGQLLGQLDDSSEGMIIFDTETEELIEVVV